MIYLQSGDVIELISWVDEEWMKGKVTGREGIFPVNFCDVVEPLPDQKPIQVRNIVTTSYAKFINNKGPFPLIYCDFDRFF